MSGVGHNQAGRHVERCGLASTVRSEQSHNLSLLHADGHIVHHRPLAVFFHQSLCPEYHALLGFGLHVHAFRFVHIR